VIPALWLLGRQDRSCPGSSVRFAWSANGQHFNSVCRSGVPGVETETAKVCCGSTCRVRHRDRPRHQSLGGNYGWIVLFRFSFISGRYPAQIPHVLTIREYVYALVYGAVAVADRVAVWILLGLLAWRRRQDPLLIVVSFAVLAHFLLYPSPEDRYLVWAYVITGIVLIRSFDEQNRQTGVAALTHEDSVRLL